MSMMREFWVEKTTWRTRYWAARACDWLIGAVALLTFAIYCASADGATHHWQRYDFDTGPTIMVSEPDADCQEWHDKVLREGPLHIRGWRTVQNSNLVAVSCWSAQDEREVREADE